MPSLVQANRVLVSWWGGEQCVLSLAGTVRIGAGRGRFLSHLCWSGGFSWLYLARLLNCSGKNGSGARGFPSERALIKPQVRAFSPLVSAFVFMQVRALLTFGYIHPEDSHARDGGARSGSG